MVEISQLRQEWEAARNGGKGGNNEPILEHEIDVVGDDSDNDDDLEQEEARDQLSPSRASPDSLQTSQKPVNAFSIDNLLASRHFKLESKAELEEPAIKEETQQ